MKACKYNIMIYDIMPDTNVKYELNEIIGPLNNIYKTMDAEGSKLIPQKRGKDNPEYLLDVYYYRQHRTVNGGHCEKGRRGRRVCVSM